MALSREELIRQIYRDQLGRDEVDAPGLNYWMNSQLGDEQLSGAIGFAAQQPTVDETARPADNTYMAEQMAHSPYALFLRQQNFGESEIQSALAAAKEKAYQRIKGDAAGWDDRRFQAQRGMDESFAGRGMYRTGRRLTDSNRARARIDDQQMASANRAYDQIGGMDRQAAQDIAKWRREGAEQNLGARQALTQGSVTYT